MRVAREDHLEIKVEVAITLFSAPLLATAGEPEAADRQMLPGQVAVLAVEVAATTQVAQAALGTLLLLAHHKDQMVARQDFRRQITEAVVAAAQVQLALVEHQPQAATVAQARPLLLAEAA